MRIGRSVIALASTATLFAVAVAFGVHRNNSAVGYAQGVERSAGIGAMGTMGFLIESVEPGSPAEQIGMQRGDMIVSLGRRPVQSMQDMWDVFRNSLIDPDKPIEVVYLRYDPVANRLVDHKAMVRPVIKEREAGASAFKGVISGGVLNGKAIEKPAPTYPDEAKAARASGTVTVSIVVDEEGRVEKAEAVSGHPLLRQAAVEAAYQACFSPTRLSGQPVKVAGVITYNFALP